MRPLTRWTAALLLALGGCASSRSAGDETPARPRPAYRRDLITIDEIERKHWTNVYEMVAELHGNWLHDRGPDTIIGEPGVLQVHMDGMRLGDVTTLRTIPVMNIATVQYFDPISASARWGLGYGHGAILITTQIR